MASGMPTMSKSGYNWNEHIFDFAAGSVHVETWNHSGPVNVSLEDVDVSYMLDRLDLEKLTEYINARKRKRYKKIKGVNQ